MRRPTIAQKIERNPDMVDMRRAITALTKRVKVLEEKMTSSEGAIKEACEKATTAASNSQDILNFLTVARQWRKYGRTALGFVSGLAAAAGIGNPAVWAFLRSVFGTH